MNPAPTLLSWSSGKDCALALERLHADPATEVVGLLTTLTMEGRVSAHGVRRELLHQQVESLGLPLHEIVIPPESSNEEYEAAWRDGLAALPAELAGARQIAFGDICLEDLREYRESLIDGLGYESVFPLWGEPTDALAREIIGTGFGVRVVVIDTEALPAELVGSIYDTDFLARLPEEVDPCGERGEFHTFVASGPGFQWPIEYDIGETTLESERFTYLDLIPTGIELPLTRGPEPDR